MLRTKLSSLSLKASKQGLLKRGFTLIELLVVIGIIAIMAALAYPSYQNYNIRARVSEAVQSLDACHATVAAAYQTGSTAAQPGQNGWGCENTVATKYVTSIVTSADGMATAQLSSDTGLGLAGGLSITLMPLKTATTAATAASDLGKVLYGFRCGSVTDGTTVPNKFLPSSCIAP